MSLAEIIMLLAILFGSMGCDVDFAPDVERGGESWIR
jgi:hypothetical protein